MLLAHNVLKDSNTEDDQSSMEQVENAKGDCLEKGHKGQLNLLCTSTYYYYAKGRLKTTYTTNYILLRHFSSREKLCIVVDNSGYFILLLKSLLNFFY